MLRRSFLLVTSRKKNINASVNDCEKSRKPADQRHNYSTIDNSCCREIEIITYEVSCYDVSRYEVSRYEVSRYGALRHEVSHYEVSHYEVSHYEV